MVVKSMTTLKERGGSSLQAIKKHISSEYKVDIDRLTPFIKKYLKSAVAAKKSTGGTKKVAKPKSPKKAKATKPKAPKPKKPKTPKKAAPKKAAKK
ncbi:unnamed protein product [Larinioides sclopetarius]|uniref:H15 domain-containing protein n=1 Tax=Larinioides sclopetarius TaxID=280406 RepID=A0AAV2AFA5_9ARAC